MVSSSEWGHKGIWLKFWCPWKNFFKLITWQTQLPWLAGMMTLKSTGDLSFEACDCSLYIAKGTVQRFGAELVGGEFNSIARPWILSLPYKINNSNNNDEGNFEMDGYPWSYRWLKPACEPLQVEKAISRQAGVGGWGAHCRLPLGVLFHHCLQKCLEGYQTPQCVIRTACGVTVFVP